MSLGRRFRSLKLWFVLRAYGAAGLRKLIRTHVALAADLAAWLESDGRFELVAPAPLGLVTFKVAAGDGATRSLAAAINASNRVQVTPMDLDGTAIIRVSVGQSYTGSEHVDVLRAIIDEHTPTTEDRDE